MWFKAEFSSHLSPFIRKPHKNMSLTVLSSWLHPSPCEVRVPTTAPPCRSSEVQTSFLRPDRRQNCHFEIAKIRVGSYDSVGGGASRLHGAVRCTICLWHSEQIGTTRICSTSTRWCSNPAGGPPAGTSKPAADYRGITLKWSRLRRTSHRHLHVRRCLNWIYWRFKTWMCFYDAKRIIETTVLLWFLIMRKYRQNW